MIEINYWDFFNFIDAVNPSIYVPGEFVEQLVAQMMGWA